MSGYNNGEIGKEEAEKELSARFGNAADIKRRNNGFRYKDF